MFKIIDSLKLKNLKLKQNQASFNNNLFLSSYVEKTGTQPPPLKFSSIYFNAANIEIINISVTNYKFQPPLILKVRN